MSIQDDIFDVQHALKRKKDIQPALDRLLEYMYCLEEQCDEYQKVFDGIDQIEQAIINLKKEAAKK